MNLRYDLPRCLSRKFKNSVELPIACIGDSRVQALVMGESLVDSYS